MHSVYRFATEEAFNACDYSAAARYFAEPVGAGMFQVEVEVPEEAEEGDRFFFGSAIAGEHDQICSYGLGKSTVRVIRGGIRGGTP